MMRGSALVIALEQKAHTVNRPAAERETTYQMTAPLRFKPSRANTPALFNSGDCFERPFSHRVIGK